MLTQGITPDRETIEQRNGEYPRHIREFASAHYACVMSYYLAEKGAQHPTKLLHLTTQGTYRNHWVKQLPMVPGMYGYLLLPEDKNDLHIKIVFRGTDFDETESALINLESQGPSTDSFPKIKEAVLAYVKNNIHEHYGESMPPLHLSVHGHSQGSSTSQLFVTALLQARVESNDFDCVQELTMTNLNDPGVPTNIRLQADELATQQFIQGKPLKLKANWGMVGGDIVQTLGQDMIFARLPQSICEVNLLKIDKDLEGSWRKNLNLRNGLQWTELFKVAEDTLDGVVGAHSNINFFTMNTPDGRIDINPIRVGQNYEYYSNKTPSHIPNLQSELLYKADKALALFQGLHKIVITPCKLGYHALKMCTDALPFNVQDYLHLGFGAHGYFAHEIYQSYQRGDFDFQPTVMFSRLANQVSGWFKQKSQAPTFTVNTLGILELNKENQLSTDIASRSVRP